MIDDATWGALRRLFASTFPSSLHFAVASLGPDGEPWVTPVGTVLLHGPGHASYFEIYARGLGARLAVDPRVSLLAVDSGKRLWLGALFRGRFARPPAVRLRGRAHRSTRESTPQERRRLRRRLRGVLNFEGGRLLWPDLQGPVRDLEIERVEPINLGALTGGLEGPFGHRRARGAER